MYGFLYGPDSSNTKLFLAINGLHHPLLDPFMQGLIYLGSSKMLLAYLPLLVVFTFMRPKSMPWSYPVVYLLAALTGILLQALLKMTFQVPRPLVALGPDAVRVLGELPLSYAFPSGHSLFAGVTAASLGWNRSLAWKTPLWLYAFFVCWSRIYVGAHYPLDVVGGVVIGAVVGWAFWLRAENLLREGKE